MAPSFPTDFTVERESKKFSQKVLPQMMGKSRKISKGHVFGFVPDYRHVVVTMAESEGFGSSGRVDTEITASEDSCAPQRKYSSLNVDNYYTFGVPAQNLSLSQMSQFERKDLEIRLKGELEQIRLLQKRICSVSSNYVAMSPTSDIHSCTDGHKRPVPQNLKRSVKGLASHGKKLGPPGRNGSTLKREKPLPPSASNVTAMKQCGTLLNQLMKHQHGWILNTPVDVVSLNIPDYYNVIKHPMDLGTVKTKLTSGVYLNPFSFAADVRLTFSNAMTYNPPGNDVHYMAETVSKYFEVRWKHLEKKLLVTKNKMAPSNPSVFIETETFNRMPLPKKKKITPAENNVRREPVKTVLTEVYRHNLSMELEVLLPELPDRIIDFLKDSSSNGNQTTDDEIEIDIDTLSDDTLLTLRKLLDDYLAEKQAKSRACEIELHNESGFSNSFVQPCKGSGPVDEDVDIGGNDMPISSFPSVEIEKEPAPKNSKCSSSSSSSSDSDSSSSDSDSGSSSGSESDGAKASTAKETIGSGANLEQQKGDNHLELGKYGSSQVEQKSLPKPVSVETEEECTPSERQVSPDKLYRAALLRNRFADTILKAQEKTVEKDEKQDPEKLRVEKEETERRRREEKARLQAEARVAEEARERAAVEAAAEAKRMREIEREAARQALQKMEKTVHINENCEFMDDLEMLRAAAPNEQLENSVDERSPANSQDCFGSFKIVGNSNPLEQLGLYMKPDDEDNEEEDAECPSVPALVVVDVAEEGGEMGSN